MVDIDQTALFQPINAVEARRRPFYKQYSIWARAVAFILPLSPKMEFKMAYIVGCRGSSQLGGPWKGAHQGYKANKLKSH